MSKLKIKQNKCQRNLTRTLCWLRETLSILALTGQVPVERRRSVPPGDLARVTNALQRQPCSCTLLSQQRYTSHARPRMYPITIQPQNQCAGASRLLLQMCHDAAFVFHFYNRRREKTDGVCVKEKNAFQQHAYYRKYTIC